MDMTREEEIMARLNKDTAVYCDGVGNLDSRADDDMEYLLVRNEGLQRRVEKMQAVVDAARSGFINYYGSLDAASNEHIESSDADDEALLLKEIIALDAADTTEE